MPPISQPSLALRGGVGRPEPPNLSWNRQLHGHTLISSPIPSRPVGLARSDAYRTCGYRLLTTSLVSSVSARVNGRSAKSKSSFLPKESASSRLHTEPCHPYASYILMTLLSTSLPLPLHIAHGMQRLYFHSNFTDSTNKHVPLIWTRTPWW